MKKYINIFLGGLAFFSIIGLTACKKYLDKAPDASISPTDAYKNFTNFQGFTEELYNCIPEFTGWQWNYDWNMGEEVVHPDADGYLTDVLDKGNGWGCINNWLTWLDASSYNTSPGWPIQQGLWPNCWYGIHKANLGLANLDKLTGTQEEKNLIKGQLLFFRGWFHFELMTYWGGLPYIDTVLSADTKLELPRLSYQAMADLAAKDFRAAADILPVDWDSTVAGQATQGKNQQRITKVMALAYLGKNYLYAGSPLMNRSSTGSATYNTDYCKKAADAFAELLKLVDSHATLVQLVNFSNYSNLFYTNGGSFIPGYPESILSSPVYSAWGDGCQWGPSSSYADANISGSYISPNARFVENYGMKNGLPIDDPNSGYNPADPWVNRDPRFYHDIVIDGDQQIKGSAPADKEKYRYADLSNTGFSRTAGTGRTGYMLRKLTPMTANNIDGFPNNYMHISYMRLADVYLMYAEAVLQGYGNRSSTAAGYSLTAEAAVNKIRERCGTGDVDPGYTGTAMGPNAGKTFMNEIIRERAMELGFEEEIRYNDLRRWLLAGELKYREKTAINFDRASNGKPINISESVLVTRVFADRNYWLPLRTTDVFLYVSFPQNPGW
jgi:hypothetical protein